MNNGLEVGGIRAEADRPTTGKGEKLSDVRDRTTVDGYNMDITTESLVNFCLKIARRSKQNN